MKMAVYQEKSAVKDMAERDLRINKKIFQYEELPHELFLTTKKATQKSFCKQYISRYKT